MKRYCIGMILALSIISIAFYAFADSREAGRRAGRTARRGAQETRDFGEGAREGAGCFVATAVYGSYEAPEVKTLRTFRDEHLLPNRAGRCFVRFYYKNGPQWADFVNEHTFLKKPIHEVLDVFVFTLE